MFKPNKHEKPFSQVLEGYQVFVDKRDYMFNVYNLSTGELELNTMNSNKAEDMLYMLAQFKKQ